MADPYLPAERDPYRTPAPAESSGRTSERSRAVAVALGATLGFMGGHRFYAGKIGTGLMMTFSLGGFGLWWLYDFILLVSGQFKDKQGRYISQWAPNEMPPPGMVSVEMVEQLRAEVHAMRDELMDVHERIDFQERLLQRGRQ